jgi:hypothetical protein
MCIYGSSYSIMPGIRLCPGALLLLRRSAPPLTR